MSVKNAIIGILINLLAAGVWHYLSEKKVNPVVVVSAVIWGLLFLIFGREDSTDSFVTKLWQKLVPRKTVKFISKMTYGYEGDWDKGEVRGEPAMHVHSKWYATNVTDESVWILRAYLVKPRTEEAMVLTQSPESNMFGKFPILPGGPSEVSVNFWIQPPIRKEGESFKGQIVFIDQFNNKHKVKATFESHSQEGELILSIRPNLRYQNELNSKLLPKAIRKKLKRKGESLSYNLDISVQDTKWEIKDPEKSRLIYTAKIEDRKLNLYKRFIPPPRQKPVRVSYSPV